MIKKLKAQPFYLLLLPVFFVLHGYLENFGFISAKDAGILTLSYCAMTMGIVIFSYIFFRDKTKAAIITSVWMSFFFFFAAIHEFFKEHPWVEIFSRYSFLLGSSILLLIILFVILKKSKGPFLKFNLFLNVLLLTYILVDLGGVIWKSINPNYKKLSVYDFARKNQYNICDACSKPDIYFLLFDEYASSLALREKYNFFNNVDSSLMARGFHVQSKSHSNYNFTPFSMSSILNMSYIDGIKDVKAITADDYANCNLLIRDNEVIKLLDAHGYEINNFSIFELAGHPSMVKQSFLPLKTKLITDRTLFARMNKDIGWLLITRFPFNLFAENNYLKHIDNNNKFLNLLKKSTWEKRTRPRFYYAHLYMPHAPFFYDRYGNKKDNQTIFNEYNTLPASAYLDYVIYTNAEMMKLVDSIQKNNPSAAIIILGDHGFRTKTDNPMPMDHFQNINAIYYPDKDYRLLYDSISGVNEFRVVMNKLFHQTFPLLKDSSIFLIDNKKQATRH